MGAMKSYEELGLVRNYGECNQPKKTSQEGHVELCTSCLMTRHAEWCEYSVLKVFSSALTWTPHSISTQYALVCVVIIHLTCAHSFSSLLVTLSAILRLR